MVLNCILMILLKKIVYGPVPHVFLSQTNQCINWDPSDGCTGTVEANINDFSIEDCDDTTSDEDLSGYGRLGQHKSHI